MSSYFHNLKKKVKKQRTCSITGKSLIFGDKWICFLKIPVKYFKGMNSDSFPMAAINRIPQSGWCDKAEMLSLPVLEVTSFTASCQEGHILPEVSRGKSFLALPSSCQQPLAFLGLQPPHSNLSLHLRGHLPCVSLSPNLPPLCFMKTSVLGLRVHRPPVGPHLNSLHMQVRCLRSQAHLTLWGGDFIQPSVYTFSSRHTPAPTLVLCEHELLQSS